MKLPKITGDIQNLPLGAWIVRALQGRPVSAQAPTTNQVLTWNGSQWAPATPSGGPGSGVPSVDGITSAVTLDAGSNVTITDNSPSAGHITIASSIPNSGVTAATYGDTTHVGQFTVGSDGRITAAANDAIAFPVTSFNTRTGAIVPATGDYEGVVASALTGATAATRYVGGVASGHPTTGTFAVGDFVVDQTGQVWVCTAAGSPGTWAAVGASGNLVTSVFTRTGAVVSASGDYTAAQVTNAADKSSSSQQNFTGELKSPDIVAGGLTGATSVSRYVGATTSAAPASGTFVKGDFIIDQTGQVWVCTTAGSPGTWTAVGATGNLVTSVDGRTGAVTGLADLTSSSQQTFTATIATTKSGVGYFYNPGTSGSPALYSSVAAEANPRFTISSDGAMQWGAGSTNAVDTTLIRSTTSTLGLTGSFTASGAITSSSATGGVGYTTGAGGTVTQLTSRTTGVTLSKPTGLITLVSAAGSSTWATFTVTNTVVAATDYVGATQVSGANLYNVIVTKIAAGSFNISVSAVSGTTTESPTIRFFVEKSVSA